MGLMNSLRIKVTNQLIDTPLAGLLSGNGQPVDFQFKDFAKVSRVVRIQTRGFPLFARERPESTRLSAEEVKRAFRLTDFIAEQSRLFAVAHPLDTEITNDNEDEDYVEPLSACS